MRRIGDGGDRSIEIAMFLAKRGELRLQGLFFFVGHGTGEPLF
jgi:hypothetical protein